MRNQLMGWHFPLVIEYDSNELPDGFGAQAVRLVGIYSIASKFRLQYRHSPIRFIPKEELVGFPYSEEKYKSIMDKIVELTFLPDTKKTLSERRLVVKRRVIGRKALLLLIVVSILRKLLMRQQLVLSLCLPQGVTDKMPKILELGAEEMRKNFDYILASSKNEEVVIHFRGGFRVVDSNRPQLTPDYYNAALKQASRYMNLSKITIHTDFFPSDLQSSNLSNRAKFFIEWFNSHQLQKMCSEIEAKHYAPIVDSLEDMIQSKLLIMSNSSLSYFAGLINPNIIIWPPIHGHSRLPRWKRGPEFLDSHMFIDKNHVPYTNWIDPSNFLPQNYKV